VDPWLTNKAGKQEAKKDDDEHESEYHESDGGDPLVAEPILLRARQGPSG
jgi:hypothetical protein